MPPRLGHKKSRGGCARCKRRRVKCDEKRPCTACVRHGTECSLVQGPPSAATSPDEQQHASPPGDMGLSTVRSSSNGSFDRPVPGPSAMLRRDLSASGSQQTRPISSSTPLSTPDRDPYAVVPIGTWYTDLELMHHYSTSACLTLPRSADLQNVWQLEIPKIALTHVFLLHQVLAFSALHLATLRPERRAAYALTASQHQTDAVAGMRAALPRITAANCDPLFAASSLLLLSAYAMFPHQQQSSSPDQPLPSPTVDNILDVFLLIRGMSEILDASELLIRRGTLGHLFAQETAPPTSTPLLDSVAARLMTFNAAIDPTNVVVARELEGLISWIHRATATTALPENRIAACLTLPRSADLQHVWQLEIPKIALTHVFLLHQVLAFSALHLATLRPERRAAYALTASQHQTDAVAGMRAALPRITAANCDPLFAASSLLLLSAYAMFPHQQQCSSPDQPLPSPTVDNILDVFLLIRGMSEILDASELLIRRGTLGHLFAQETAPPTSTPLLDSVAARLTTFNAAIDPTNIDAQQNETLYKRYLRKGDIYCHADMHGAATVIVKNKQDTPDAPIPPSTLAQAGMLSVCSSSAWDSKAGMGAWWVRADQVSKSAPTGEYLPAGSFMVRGQKNFLPPAPLVLGLGIMFRISEESKAKHVKHRLRGEESPAGAAGGYDTATDSALDVDDGDENEEDEDEDEREDEADDNQENDARDNPLQGTNSADADADDDADGERQEQQQQQQEEDDDEKQKEAAPVEQMKDLQVSSEAEEPAETNPQDEDEGSESEAAEEDSPPQGSAQTTAAASKQAVPAKTAPAKRGKKGKAKKMAAKYKYQDEDDRAAAEALIGAAAGRQKAEAEAQARAEREAQAAAQKERRRAQHQKQQKATAEHEEIRRLMHEEGVELLEADEAEKATALDGLVGTPLVGDEIVEAIPVCAPWNALGRFKYKVKFQPGPVKKGKAVKEVLERWKLVATKKGVVDERAQDSERMWPREVELIKAFKPEEVINSVPVGKLKVMMGAGGGGGGKGSSGKGGRGGKGSKRK
ncbi:hypothetical protein BN1723_002538 [Verticillium longisporum]|uniref:Zn(2)-C6 fungal-type domain-containing protein n=1 Tax=Verticillium longisporum TaxID=100787 RepID=A0A0G4LCB8_VERLO|nr:hypothetical protein BN1723_002538 [Verticillium longisporum]